MERRSKESFRTMIKNNKIYMDLKEILREHSLRYLPAKALYRSLSVCRDWKLQISSPFFVHNQSISFSSVSGFFLQSPENQNPPSFVTHNRMAYGVPDQELKFLPEPVDLKASANGLLCCQSRTGEKLYYVCNPVNQHWKKIPKPSENHGPNPMIALAFEPSLLNFSADYKLVCIFPSNDIEEAYEFEIYSSLQDSWKVSSEMYFSKGKLQCIRGDYSNGVIYWPTTSGKLLIFDVKKEKVKQTYAHLGKSIGMVNGKLCNSFSTGLSITVNVLQSLHANTLPMRSKTDTWKVEHKVQLNAADIQLQRNDQLRVLFTWDNLILLRADGVCWFSTEQSHMSMESITMSSMVRPGIRFIIPLFQNLVIISFLRISASSLGSCNISVRTLRIMFISSILCNRVINSS
ncbi:hypothetical protein SOVF_003770 isoform B [Spinacia oleracea]|nr:uncharacterized protein LOC130467928 isoform X2 [Spinacia oleracea]KNA25778.1 hypothetical protein SOVF_003770 isoform B [Spinacia oleracea]